MTEATVPLPAPFSTISAAAYLQQQGRRLVWSLNQPGILARNRYLMARIEISERVLWRGEPLGLSATRRADDNGGWSGFTAAGKRILHDQLVPVVARYGFDRLWTEVHTARYDPATGRAQADQARCEATWWDTAAELAHMYHHGQITLRALPSDRRHRELVAGNGAYPYYHRDEVVAEALHHGEHVGWLTTDGTLIPDSTLLQPAGQ